MCGAVQIENFDNLKSNVNAQKAASAWNGIEWSALMGASYKPLLYVGTQIVKGVNHCFIAEQTLITREPVKHIVTIKINEFDGEYTIVKGSIVQIY